MIEITDNKINLLTLTADIVAAHVSNNNVPVGDLAALIANVHGSLAVLGEPPKIAAHHEMKPAVSIRASIKPDYIICLEDGRKLKMLKRHLMKAYGMTPAAYREKWALPADYPMVAPVYAEQRRTLAKQIGLGRQPRKESPAPAAASEAPKRKARKPNLDSGQEPAAASETPKRRVRKQKAPAS